MKTVQLTIICLLAATVFSNCSIIHSITNDIPQNLIIGKWKLVKTVSGRTAQGTISQTYDTVDVILEFKDNDILTVKCLRQDGRCVPYRDGDYSYQFRDNGNSWYDKKIEIDKSSWWYRISEKQLELTQGPVDGGSYIFERLNISELQQTNNVIEPDVCVKCENKPILKVLVNEPANIKKGCYNVFGKEYSFMIVLLNQPNVEYYFSKTIYPCGGVPDKFQVDGLHVLISGNILDCRDIVVCNMSSNARYAASYLFELKTITQ